MGKHGRGRTSAARPEKKGKPYRSSAPPSGQGGLRPPALLSILDQGFRAANFLLATCKIYETKPAPFWNQMDPVGVPESSFSNQNKQNLKNNEVQEGVWRRHGLSTFEGRRPSSCCKSGRHDSEKHPKCTPMGIPGALWAASADKFGFEGPAKQNGEPFRATGAILGVWAPRDLQRSPKAKFARSWAALWAPRGLQRGPQAKIKTGIWMKPARRAAAENHQNVTWRGPKIIKHREK